ncbi:MAG: hypothetical protein JRI25_07965, partial [Deltaproteobacteria bacterium]|nr:hypothetical protein [Deltaproteobacteria bacterium]
TYDFVGQNFYDDPTHLRPYTKVGLRRLLVDSGFTSVSTGTKRSPYIVMLGLPYALLAPLVGDPQARAIYTGNLLGTDIGAVGRKA